MASQAEKAANLDDGEQNAILADDEVIEVAEFLVLRVVDVRALQLAEPVAIRNGHHVDDNELDFGTGGLRTGNTVQHSERDNGNQFQEAFHSFLDFHGGSPRHGWILGIRLSSPATGSP